jgi:3-oxoacyl-[acyl-carrier-protein] synthase II
MGLVTPIGNTVEENWQAILAGRSGIGPITRFDPAPFATRFAGEVKNFDVTQFLDSKEVRRNDRYVHYAVAAADEALASAGFEASELPAERTGIIIGSGMGGLESFEVNTRALFERGPRRVSPYFVPLVIANIASGVLSIRYGTRGPNYSTVSACATGAHAIGDGLDLIRLGRVDVMIVGGAEAALTQIGLAGFNAARALSTRNDAPEQASRPFDAERDGFVMAEGAGVLVLERLEHARARGARIWAELLGIGMSSDAFHITAPPEDGGGAALALRNLLDEAQLSPSDVGYINAHATSTPQGDIAEVAAIKSVFGEHANALPISSTKSMTGHLLGAAGAVEAAYTILALHHQILPPTINYQHPDPACAVDCVPNEPRPATFRVAVSNAFGFGGTNAALAFSRFE